MILKSYIVEQNLNILKDYIVTLMYGENSGIKDDIKEEIKIQNKDAEILNFFESDIVKNNLLFENTANQSLFDEKKIIFIHEASDKIIETLEECLKIKNKDISIYIFAENLEKKSKLRNWFEKDKNLAIFACYEDNERTLITYVNKEFKNYKGLTGEIINLIINNSNMDRRIIKSEILKIKDYFLQKKINKDKIIEILNIKTDSNFNEIRDKALMGEKDKINKLLSETNIINEDVFFYLNNMNYRILKLYEISKISEGNKNNYEKILSDIRPPVFWKDKPIMIQQLKKWGKEKLEEIIYKINETEILMKKSSYLRNDIIIKDLILYVTNKASTS
jgi:DNA polymerase III subunit delta